MDDLPMPLLLLPIKNLPLDTPFNTSETCLVFLACFLMCVCSIFSLHCVSTDVLCNIFRLSGVSTDIQ